MKKVLLMFMVGFFAFSSNVKADEPLLCDIANSQFYNAENLVAIKSGISKVLDVYSMDYKSDYPYFLIDVIPEVSSKVIYIRFHLFSNLKFKSVSSYDSHFDYTYFAMESDGVNYISLSLTIGINDDGSFPYSDVTVVNTNAYYSNFYYKTVSNCIHNLPFYANFDFPEPLRNFNGSAYDNIGLQFVINSSNYEMLSGDFKRYLKNADYLYHQFEGFEDVFSGAGDPKYTEVNLNNYAYIALSLKDYSKKTAFSSSTYVKGQSCITPVYNFSQSFKPNGSQNICSAVYPEFTQSDLHVLSSDIENNIVYYVSAYDKSIENYIKVDNSVFDISYITEENKDKPVITVNGTDYNGIPLDQISYSANKNTENGLIPGESENIADSFTDIIKKPVEFFKDIISGISSFFSLITTFISMMPPVLQSFIYFSFVIAIILGIIKIFV